MKALAEALHPSPGLARALNLLEPRLLLLFTVQTGSEATPLDALWAT